MVRLCMMNLKSKRGWEAAKSETLDAFFNTKEGQITEKIAGILDE